MKGKKTNKTKTKQQQYGTDVQHRIFIWNY